MANTLNAGESLVAGQQLRSNNGMHILYMQPDGNLVQYQGNISISTAVWATNTWNLPETLRPSRADMQQDGNFVLYSNTNVPIWASGTDGHPGSRLVLQDDRNLVIYDSNNRPVWANNISLPQQRSEVRASKSEDVG